MQACEVRIHEFAITDGVAVSRNTHNPSGPGHTTAGTYYKQRWRSISPQQKCIVPTHQKSASISVLPMFPVILVRLHNVPHLGEPCGPSSEVPSTSPKDKDGARRDCPSAQHSNANKHEPIPPHHRPLRPCSCLPSFASRQYHCPRLLFTSAQVVPADPHD
jgi:hypothetical protein